MTREPAPHFSYPKRDGYFADVKRIGHGNTNITTDQHHRMWAEGIEAAVQRQFVQHPVPEAPMAVDVPFDWTETQGDLAPIIRKVERGLLIAALVMAGWFAGCLMALYMLKGVW